MVIELYAVNSAVKVLCLLCIAICCLGCVELLETGQMLHDVFKSHCLMPQHIVYAKASQESQRFCVCQEALQFWTQTKRLRRPRGVILTGQASATVRVTSHEATHIILHTVARSEPQRIKLK